MLCCTMHKQAFTQFPSRRDNSCLSCGAPLEGRPQTALAMRFDYQGTMELGVEIRPPFGTLYLLSIMLAEVCIR